MSTKLKDLEVEEMSGVKNPANGLPGWVVMKGASLVGEIDRAELDYLNLLASLGVTKRYLEDDEDALAAHTALTKYVNESIFGEKEEEEEEKARPARKSFLERVFGDRHPVRNQGSAEEDEDEDESVSKDEDEDDENDLLDESFSEEETEIEDEDEFVSKDEDEDEDEDEEDERPSYEELEGERDALAEAVEKLIGRVERLETRSQQPDEEEEDEDGSVTKQSDGPKRSIMRALQGGRVIIR